MINGKTFFFFHFGITFQKKKNDFYWSTTIMKKLFFFISSGRSLWKYLLTWSFIGHYITNLLKKFPDSIVPGKSMCNLKNFFLRNFSRVLHDLLPVFRFKIIFWHSYQNMIIFSWIKLQAYYENFSKYYQDRL